MQVSDKIRETIYRQVRADLCPSRTVVHAKVGAAVTVGGLLSLFLCGQLGLGLSTVANEVHHALMARVGFLGCTVTCGLLFAVVPVLVLRLVSSAMQFQVLFRKEWKAIVSWVVVFGAILAFQNDRSDPMWVLALWILAAVLSFKALAQLLHLTSVHASHMWPHADFSR